MYTQKDMPPFPKPEKLSLSRYARTGCATTSIVLNKWFSVDGVRSANDEFSWNYQHQHDVTLQWRHNESSGVSNHRRRHCLLNRFFRRRSKKSSKLRVTGLCEGNPTVTGICPWQMFPSVIMNNGKSIVVSHLKFARALAWNRHYQWETKGHWNHGDLWLISLYTLLLQACV